MSKNKRTPLAQGILSSDIYGGLSYALDKTPPPSLMSESEENKGDPRKTTPVKMSAISRPNYVTELSLSDSETNENNKCTKTRRRPLVTSEVVVAETDNDNLNISGEVPTRSFTIESPVKVIRHSPLPEESTEKTKTFKSNVGDSLDESKQQDASRDSSKKKRKKYVPVQSRYKQTAPRKEDLKSRSLEISAITPHPNQANQSSKNSQTKSNRVTSTPFLMTSMYERQLPGADGTFLDQSRFQSNEPVIKEPLVKKTRIKKEKESRKKETSLKDSNTDGKLSTDNIADEQRIVDLLHVRLAQITYLGMKAQQTFDKQEEKAKREMYGLWALIRKQEKEIDALKLSLETRMLEIKVDQILKYQMNGFKPLNDKISNLLTKLSHVEKALSNTFHHIPVKNIAVPREENLMRSLDESKRLLAEVNSFIRKESPKIEELTSASDVLSKTIQTELIENKRCASKLKSCNTFLNQERSLQAQLLDVS